MDLHHEFVVPLGIEEAWEAFNDLSRIGPAFPGASVTGVDGDDFSGAAKVKLGPISLQYMGTGTFLERDEAGKRAVIEASGQDRRGNGTAGATITAALKEEGPGQTRVLLDTQLRITGRPAQFGRGVIQEVGSKIIDQFAKNLTTLLASGASAGLRQATPMGSVASPSAAAAAGEKGQGAAKPTESSRDAAASLDTAPSIDAASAADAMPGADELEPAAVPGPRWTMPTPAQLVQALDLGSAEVRSIILRSVVGTAAARSSRVTVVACVATAVVTAVVTAGVTAGVTAVLTRQLSRRRG